MYDQILRMMDPATSILVAAQIITVVLLVVSEVLGLSPSSYNSVLEVVLAVMYKLFASKSDAKQTVEPVPGEDADRTTP